MHEVQFLPERSWLPGAQAPEASESPTANFMWGRPHMGCTCNRPVTTNERVVDLDLSVVFNTACYLVTDLLGVIEIRDVLARNCEKFREFEEFK